jgi:hypothetical protein
LPLASKKNQWHTVPKTVNEIGVMFVFKKIKHMTNIFCVVPAIHQLILVTSNYLRKGEKIKTYERFFLGIEKRTVSSVCFFSNDLRSRRGFYLKYQ